MQLIQQFYVKIYLSKFKIFCKILINLEKNLVKKLIIMLCVNEN